MLVVLLVVVALVATGVVLARRRPRADRIDPFTLGEPWRHHVRDALQAQRRFDDAVRALPAGPLRERLTDVGARVQQAVEECWRIAGRANDLQHALSEVRGQSAPEARLEAAVTDARQRLGGLDSRLQEAVAQAIELSVRPDADVAGLGSGVEDVVIELEALRLALEETSGN